MYFSYTYYGIYRLDAAIRPIVQNGMTPFMSISFTPAALGGTEGAGREVPNNYTEWVQCVTALVQHYENRGYTDWYWEFWNEPDWDFSLELRANLMSSVQ